MYVVIHYHKYIYPPPARGGGVTSYDRRRRAAQWLWELLSTIYSLEFLVDVCIEGQQNLSV